MVIELPVLETGMMFSEILVLSRSRFSFEFEVTSSRYSAPQTFFPVVKAGTQQLLAKPDLFRISCDREAVALGEFVRSQARHQLQSQTGMAGLGLPMLLSLTVSLADRL